MTDLKLELSEHETALLRHLEAAEHEYDPVKRGYGLLVKTRQGTLWQRWRAHMVFTTPLAALRMAWRHRHQQPPDWMLTEAGPPLAAAREGDG